MDGIVKFFNIEHEYGFIAGEDEKDYYFNYRDVIDGVILKADDNVVFDESSNERGLRALNVKHVL